MSEGAGVRHDRSAPARRAAGLVCVVIGTTFSNDGWRLEDVAAAAPAGLAAV